MIRINNNKGTDFATLTDEKDVFRALNMTSICGPFSHKAA